MKFTHDEVARVVGCDPHDVEKVEEGRPGCPIITGKIIEVLPLRPARREVVRSLYKKAFGKELTLTVQ